MKVTLVLVVALALPMEPSLAQNRADSVNVEVAVAQHLRNGRLKDRTVLYLPDMGVGAGGRERPGHRSPAEANAVALALGSPGRVLTCRKHQAPCPGNATASLVFYATRFRADTAVVRAYIGEHEEIHYFRYTAVRRGAKWVVVSERAIGMS